MVKADAYGHGSVATTVVLFQLGVTRFGVATLQEGVTLREAGVHAPILLMGAWLPEHSADIVAHELTPIIYDVEAADRLAHLIQPRSAPYPVHIKVDTGMGRLGLSPEHVQSLLDSPAFKGPLYAEGLMTHLADADNHDPAYTNGQIHCFQELYDRIIRAGLRIPLLHAANSAGILFHPSAHFTMVRPGIMLYGYLMTRDRSETADLRPVLSLTTKVAQVRKVHAGRSISYNRLFTASRPSRLAVLPVGYADGYNRLLSNRGAVLIKGQRAPIVGRICMDMTIVDVTDIPDVKPGEEAVLIGRQGPHAISAADLAVWQETIPYEVLCGIGPRVPRIYR